MRRVDACRRGRPENRARDADVSKRRRHSEVAVGGADAENEEATTR